MVILLAIITIAVFLIVDWVKLSRRKPAAETAPSPKLKEEIHTVVSERFYHPGHCWAMVEHADRVRAGVDDFTQRLIGQLEAVALPTPGFTVRQGDALAIIRRGSKTLTLVSPVSGTINLVNDALRASPEIINRSPLSKGWIAEINPSNLATELRNLLNGAVAERWLEAVRIQLTQWFTPQLGTILQDGGRLIDNISDLLNDEEWSRLTQELYPNAPRTLTEHFLDKGDQS